MLVHRTQRQALAVLVALVLLAAHLVTVALPSRADETTGQVDASGQAWRTHDLTAPADGTMTASLAWTTSADLNLFVRRIDDPGAPTVGPLLSHSRTSARPEQLSFEAEAGQDYRLFVQAASGAAAYTLVTEEWDGTDRTYLGTAQTPTQTYRSHPFAVTETSLVAGALAWDGSADLGLYLRSSSGAVVDVVRTDAQPERLTAELTPGDYEWLVRAESGSAAYDLHSQIRPGGELGTGEERLFTAQAGHVSAGGGRQVYESHEVVMASDGELAASLTALEEADLDLFVSKVATNGQVGPILLSSATSSDVEQLSLPAVAGERYRFTVKASSGSSGYDLAVTSTQGPGRAIIGTSDPASQNWRTYDVGVTEPGLLTAELDWTGPGDLALYLRDPDGSLIELSKSSAVPERLTHEAAEPGVYQVVVSSSGAAASFTLDVALQTGPDRTYPGHLGFTATGGGRQAYDSFDYTAPADGIATAVLDWEGAANFDLSVRRVVDPASPDSGPVVASSQTPATPEQLSFPATEGTTYRVYVAAPSGAAHFDLDVAVQTDPTSVAFVGTAHATGQRYRAFPMTVTGPGAITGTLSWDNGASLALFIRDEEGTVLGQDIGADQPKTVSVEVEEAGTYELVVAANSGFAPFGLQADVVLDEPAAACFPWSTLPCEEVVAGGDVVLTFDGTEGGLTDGDDVDTGFTLVDPPSARLAADGPPSNPDVPGYEPGLLDVADGALAITATRGIQYISSPPSTGTNSQINALGVGVDASGTETTVSTTLVAPDSDGTANAEKGGLWFGLDEDNLVNLTVQNQTGTNVRVQFQREVNGLSPSAEEINSAVFPEGTDVELTMVLDDEDNTATTTYQVGTQAPVALGQLSLPQSFFDGQELAADGPTASFAGVFATKRNETTNALVLSFGDFSVTQATEEPNPNTPPEVLLSGDRTLFTGQDVIVPVDGFDEDGDAVTLSVSGLPAGLSFDGADITGTVADDATGSYPVTATADDGTDTTDASFDIEVIEAVAVDINFQSAAAPTPTGYLADSGGAFGSRNGLQYGWVAEGTSTPLNMSTNGRDRNRAGIDQLLDTFMHMQYGDIAEVYGGPANCTANQCAPGSWEIALPNGLYQVTVAVGDQPSGTVYDSLHALNVEAGVLVEEFQGTAQQEYLEATAFAGVNDGRLSISAEAGANTKLSYVEIRSVGTRPMVTGMVPANRSVDVALDTSVSASVEVPGDGIGVNPDRATSLTDEAVKLFEVTGDGDVEVAGNRGSTGGNDTIAFSPSVPLTPDTTYRYVVDGVLDEAGQEFERFESLFTTGAADEEPIEEDFTPVEGVDFEKVLLPEASGDANGKFFASLVVHQGYLWATTVGQGTFRYEILPDGTLGAAQNLGVFDGRAAIGMIFDEDDPDLAWVTHATADLGNESARFGSTLSVVDFSDVSDPQVIDVLVNLPRSGKDHLSNSLSYGPSGDGGAPWLYFPQGSNQAAGDVDGSWGTRGETQLTAAVLRFDPQETLATALADGPIDVKTEELGGTYDPFADDAPLEIYATGVRNAFDLVWHSNGHLYVPTNGTAGGGNSPGVTVSGGSMTMSTTQPTGQNGYGNGTDVTQECAERRINGEPYVGGSVPAVTNHPTQRDFLFDVEQGGYYGHPNPTRCEWVLNNGGNPEGAGAGGAKYSSTVQPDPNYRGWGYDFEFNKSPNGVIEYMSETFGGALQGRLMVIRFSGNDDVLTMQVAADGEVLGAQAGTDIGGFTGYVDPLDIVEDTSVNPGNLYVNQYNRGSEPQQLYLLRVPEGEQASSLDVDPPKQTMSATLNGEQPTDTAEVMVSNDGAEAVAVTAAVTGTHADQFSVQGPGTIPAGGEATLEITFDPTGTPGTRTATVELTTPEGGSATVAIRALAFTGQEGGEEPTLAQVVDALDMDIDVGWTTLSGGTQPEAKGDEVLEPLLQRAGDGPVTMTPVAAFAPQEDLPFGWYAAADGAVTTNEVGSIADGQLQTLYPELGSGGTSFDPGSEAFGLYYDSNTFNRIGYTEDFRNDSGGLHRARIYPLSGNRFLVGFEDASNGDYQDYVFVLDNVVAASDEEPPPPPPPVDDTISVNFQSETAPVPSGYLRDFGQAYGARSEADQGGLTYGWLDADTLEPTSLVSNGRDRNVNDDQRLDTLMHMDLPEGATGGVTGLSTWGLAVPDGAYEVTVSVGDPSNGSAPESHTINVENQSAINGFPKSTAPNGSDERHLVATVSVEVLDGQLTIDAEGGENTKINYVDVVPLEDGEVVAQVNYQTAAAPTPAGWVADTGALFSQERGYGWVRTEGGSAKTSDTRFRTSESDPLDASFIIVDDAVVASVTDGEWEYALPDGEYTVSASVGDPDFDNSTHGLTAEGVGVIEAFVPDAPGDYGTGSASVEVLDGALTLASSGTNTKLQWVRITSTSGIDVVAPQVSIALDGEGSDGVYTGPVEVTVTATDRTLEFVDYTVDDGPVTNYTAPFTVSTAGAHTVEVTATDGAGNSTTRSVDFTIVDLGDGDLTLVNPEAAPFHDRLVMSRIQSTVSDPLTADTAKVVLGNDGDEPLTVQSLQIAEPEVFTLVNPPVLPFTIAVGSTQTVTVEFIGTGSGNNTVFESDLVVGHDGSDGPATVVELAGIWQSQSEGGNEPDVIEITRAFGWGTTIANPGQAINNQGRLEAIGDEVLSRTWKRLDTTKPITVRQLAAYHTCCSNTAAFGWHPVNQKGSWTQVLRHDGQWAQTLLPRINNSDVNPAFATFTPGPSIFSWRIDPESSDWTTNNTDPDECGSGNEGCQLGHHLRVWPIEDRDGEAIPGTYLVVMDYAGINYDYNDNAYLVTNVAPAD